MKPTKLLLLILIVVITMSMISWLIVNVGMQGFLFAWTLNFILMAGTFAFTETLKSPFASSYYNEKAWERRGKIYGSFGIHFFRKVLVWTGWEKLNKKANPIEKNTEALLRLHYKTKQNEFGHILILVIVLGVTIYVAFAFGILQSLWLLALNIVLNLYPILLQRYNRPRIERALLLSKRR